MTSKGWVKHKPKWTAEQWAEFGVHAVLSMCGWEYDHAAELWLTPDGRHVDADEAYEWARRTPRVQRYRPNPVTVPIVVDGQDKGFVVRGDMITVEDP
jgi:hypothetical protein